jgi:DNA-binding NtrC family response regulator
MGSPLSTTIDCVFLSCFERDVRFYAGLLACSGIRVHLADTVEMADFLLVATGGTVLLADAVFLDGSWEDALAMMRNVHPLVASILCADPVDRQFVAAAVSHGAVELFWTPLELERLRASIRRAHEVTSERQLWAAAEVRPASRPALVSH